MSSYLQEYPVDYTYNKINMLPKLEQQKLLTKILGVGGFGGGVGVEVKTIIRVILKQYVTFFCYHYN